jgi:hypothetical protein
MPSLAYLGGGGWFHTDTKNYIGDMEGGGVQVLVRVRPASVKGEEKAPVNPLLQTMTVVNDQTLIIDPPRAPGEARVRDRDAITYQYDRIFPQEATQEDVYEAVGPKVLDHVFAGDGGEAAVFAYGATCSGKTTTMIGDDNVGPGVIPRLLEDLFVRKDPTDEVYFSYIEVYLEKIYDLLSGRKEPLLMMNNGVEDKVSGLSSFKVESAEKLTECLQSVNRRRHTSATMANSQSSRSHALIQVTIRGKVHSVITLCDLAGSEKARKRDASCPRRQEESKKINESLFCLGKVIQALVQGDSHIPFRECLLTRFLKPAMVGNCFTFMITCVSPTEASHSDSFNALDYASVFKNIRSQRNGVTEITNVLKKDIADARSKVQELLAKLNKGIISERNSCMEILSSDFSHLDNAFCELEKRNYAGNLNNSLREAKLVTSPDKDVMKQERLMRNKLKLGVVSYLIDRESLDFEDVSKELEHQKSKLVKFEEHFHCSVEERMAELEDKIGSIYRKNFNLKGALVHMLTAYTLLMETARSIREATHEQGTIPMDKVLSHSLKKMSKNGGIYKDKERVKDYQSQLMKKFENLN